MTTTSPTAFMDPSALPQELFQRTLYFLSLPMIADCRGVCRAWRNRIDEGEFPINFDRPKRIWALLHKQPIKIPLPRHLQLNPVNILPLSGKWVVEDANRNCYILPDQYLGEGRLHPFGEKVLMTKKDSLHIFTNCSDPPLEIRARSWPIRGKRLLAIWGDQARLYDNDGRELFHQTEVTSAQFVKDTLVTYHPGRKIKISHLDGGTSIKTGIGNVVLTKGGNLAYEHNDQLFHNEQRVCQLGEDRLLAANDEVAFLGRLGRDCLRQVRVHSKSTAEMPVPSDWLRARITPDSWEEGHHLLYANIRSINGCTILTTYKDASTHVVITMGPNPNPIKLKSPGHCSIPLQQGCFWVSQGSKVVVFDPKGVYSMRSKEFEGRCFFSGSTLVSVDENYAYIRPLSQRHEKT